MQFFGTGIPIALYCFVHYIQSPIENFRARDLRLTNMSYTTSVLPVLVLTHYIPKFACFSTLFNPQPNNAWSWIRQPFPVYVSIAQHVLRKTAIPDTVHQDRIRNTECDLPTIRLTIKSLCALSAVAWWYTLYFSLCSRPMLLDTKSTMGQTDVALIRVLPQLDWILSMAACFSWLMYLYHDMKSVTMMHNSWLSIILGGAMSVVAFGPGVTVGLGWLYREQLLASEWHKDALVPGRSY
jgi:hypothetical protein